MENDKNNERPANEWLGFNRSSTVLNFKNFLALTFLVLSLVFIVFLPFFYFVFHQSFEPVTPVVIIIVIGILSFLIGFVLLTTNIRSSNEVKNTNGNDGKNDEIVVEKIPELFSPKTILISITILNVVLFLGGTIYTGINVQSIQQRSESSIEKINQKTQDFTKEYINSLNDIKTKKQELDDRIAEANKKIDQLWKKTKEHIETTKNDLAGLDSQVDTIRKNNERKINLIAEELNFDADKIKVDYKNKLLSKERDLDKNIKQLTTKANNLEDYIQNKKSQTNKGAVVFAQYIRTIENKVNEEEQAFIGEVNEKSEKVDKKYNEYIKALDENMKKLSTEKDSDSATPPN